MKKLIIILFIAIGLNAVAQQTPLSNFYNFNEYLINPAEAGYKNKIEGTLSHRIQWQGLDGAPKTSFFGVHTALNEKMGLGLRINMDKTDILRQFNPALSYAYRVKINEETKLHFGVSAMMVQNSVGYSEAVIGDLADEVINGGDETGANFDAEAGIMLQYKKGKLGIASRHLFESGVSYNLPENRGEGTFERVRQFTSYASYEFKLHENWTLEPFVLTRNQGIESFQWEMNALATWNKMLYAGVGYRDEAGYIVRAGFQITEALVAAYAYEFSTTGVASYSNGSHEFMIGYKIGKIAKKQPITVEPPKAVIPVETRPIEVVEKEPEEVVEPIIEKTPEPIVEEVVEEVVAEESTEVESYFAEKIVFSFESKQIPESIKGDLNEIAAILVKYPEAKVRVEGHTSTDGTDAQNQIVSERRAKLVKDYLMAQGVLESQIVTKAMLDRELLVPDNTLENKKINRRAEIELIQD